MSELALSDSFEYLCYVSTTIHDMYDDFKLNKPLRLHDLYESILAL